MPAVTPASSDGERLPQVWGEIPPRNPNFTGREQLLRRLHNDLTASKPQALLGLGGVGKSQVAIEYVFRHSREFDLVWWIPAEQVPQIRTSLAVLFQRLTLAESPAADTGSAVRQALSAADFPYPRWLLIFDNAGSVGDVRPFFPTGGIGKIIVTSRLADWRRPGGSIEVDVFSREESKSLFRRFAPEVLDADADRFAVELGDLPLAIEQAAVWRAETGMPVEDHLRLLKDKRMELFDEEFSDYSLPVGATWNVSLDKLATENLAALQLLQLCAYLPPRPIRLSLFAAARDMRIADPLDDVRRDELLLRRAVRDIGRYALAKVDRDDDRLVMHRLVKAVLRHRMNYQQQQVMRRGAQLLLTHDVQHREPQSARTGRPAAMLPGEPVDGAIVVLTALNVEFEAMRSHLTDVERMTHPAGTIFDVGRIPGSGSRVILAVIGSGTSNAAVLTEQAIAMFDPGVILVLGKAGSLKGHLNLGDVVVSTKIIAYHGSSQEGSRVKFRPEAWSGSYPHIQSARQVSVADTWWKALPGAADGRPKVEFGPVASGDVVLDGRDAPLFVDLDHAFNDVIAIEMEGAGAAKAAQLRHVPILVIRGISDKADGNKGDADRAGWSKIAARNAAAFTAALIPDFAPAGGRPTPTLDV